MTALWRRALARVGRRLDHDAEITETVYGLIGMVLVVAAWLTWEPQWVHLVCALVGATLCGAILARIGARTLVHGSAW